MNATERLINGMIDDLTEPFRAIGDLPEAMQDIGRRLDDRKEAANQLKLERAKGLGDQRVGALLGSMAALSEKAPPTVFIPKEGTLRRLYMENGYFALAADRLSEKKGNYRESLGLIRRYSDELRNTEKSLEYSNMQLAKAIGNWNIGNDEGMHVAVVRDGDGSFAVMFDDYNINYDPHDSMLVYDKDGICLYRRDGTAPDRTDGCFMKFSKMFADMAVLPKQASYGDLDNVQAYDIGEVADMARDIKTKQAVKMISIYADDIKEIFENGKTGSVLSSIEQLYKYAEDLADVSGQGQEMLAAADVAYREARREAFSSRDLEKLLDAVDAAEKAFTKKEPALQGFDQLVASAEARMDAPPKNTPARDVESQEIG